MNRVRLIGGGVCVALAAWGAVWFVDGAAERDLLIKVIWAAPNPSELPTYARTASDRMSTGAGLLVAGIAGLAWLGVTRDRGSAPRSTGESARPQEHPPEGQVQPAQAVTTQPVAIDQRGAPLGMSKPLLRLKADAGSAQGGIAPGPMPDNVKAAVVQAGKGMVAAGVTDFPTWVRGMHYAAGPNILAHVPDVYEEVYNAQDRRTQRKLMDPTKVRAIPMSRLMEYAMRQRSPRGSKDLARWWS